MPAYTPDNIALGIIAEGRRTRTNEGQRDHPPISDKGIKQALACGLVESNLKMYANNGDPDSFTFPHDGVSADKNSAGVFQQRAPWWGTVEDRMDVARSAALFYNSLVKQRVNGQDYNTDAVSPGTWVAMVQQPREDLRGRYDERWADATRIFNTLHDEALPPGGTPAAPAHPMKPQFTEIEMFGNGSSSRSRPPINFLLHTQEGSWDATAKDLAAFCQGQNNVSYHYTIRDRIVYDVVDTDRYSWSVLDANVFTINLCFAGSSVNQSRQQWLDRYGPDLEIAAYLAVQDCRKYNFSTEVIAPPYHEAPGISDHKYVTEQLHIGTHTDVGPNFPWNTFADYVAKYAGTGPGPAPLPPPTGDPDYMAKVPQDQWDAVFQVITQKRKSRCIYAEPDAGPVGDFADMGANVDAMKYQELIENNAIKYGDDYAIGRIVAVAANEGVLYPNDPWAIQHAKEVLKDIDAGILRAWSERHKGA